MRPFSTFVTRTSELMLIATFIAAIDYVWSLTPCLEIAAQVQREPGVWCGGMVVEGAGGM